MALSHQERRTLEQIERGLHCDDPTLAARMAVGSVTAGAGLPGRWAWFGVLLGLQVTLVGFAASAGVISFGTVIGFYGLLLLGSSAMSLLCGLRRRPG
jgi:hypothetical protein